jgi:membrane-associated protease RseP (regulator of RpoE activity)
VLRYPNNLGFLNAFLRFLMLTFALNFVVGAVNLVPLPLFDGGHIMKNGVGNKWAANAIMLILAASFLLTLFPWVLR